MQTLLAASTNTLTYAPKVDDVLTQGTSCTAAVTDADGDALTLSHDPTWTTAGYVLTVDPDELPATLADTWVKVAWTWVVDGETRRDVEYAWVSEVDVPAPLASPTDLVAHGYTKDAAAYLSRASVRVRGYTKQDITTGTSTVTLGYPFLLPQRPVVSVTSCVTDAGSTFVADTDYTVDGCYIRTAYKGRLTVTYAHGFATLPERLVEVVCAIANRLASQPAALANGAQAEGGEGSITWGFDAYSGVADLTSGEKEVLDAIFPHTRKVPSVAVTM